MTMRVRYTDTTKKDIFGTVIKIFEWVDGSWTKIHSQKEHELFNQIPDKSKNIQYIVNWDKGANYSAHYAGFLEIAQPINLKSIW